MKDSSKLRILISNGWTRVNRRLLKSEIGEKAFNELLELSSNANMCSSSYNEMQKFIATYSIDGLMSKLKSIINAYRKYAKNPYINEYLRKGLPLSEESKEIVDSLRFAINRNRVSGTFVRGLSPNRTNRLENIEDVSAFIFGNKGFTSVVPNARADYANCFALGKNGVKVIFDIKNMPGYRASDYEVLFDTNAFTKDKFSIQKIGEKLYRVIQK